MLIVIADGYLWERGLGEEAPLLDAPGDPILGNIEPLKGKTAQILSPISNTARGQLLINRFLREYLPDAEIWSGYGFPYGSVLGSVVVSAPVVSLEAPEAPGAPAPTNKKRKTPDA